MRTRGHNEGDERGGSLLEGGGVEGETSSGKQTNKQTHKPQKVSGTALSIRVTTSSAH